MSSDVNAALAPANTAQANLIAALRGRVVKIFADGTEAPASDPRTDHHAVWFPDRGVMVHPVSLGKAPDKPLSNFDACVKRCSDLRVLGQDDWQLALLEEWQAFVLDRRLIDPAVDPNLYPGVLPRWHWTNTDVAGSSASAWVVYASDGVVDLDRRGGNGFALAVRRAGQ